VTLQADSGRLDEASRVFTALGHVTASTRNGSVSLETAELVYDPATDLFRSDSATVVEQGGRTQRLSCFESDPLLTNWHQCRESS
ncbi:MAG TPA: hypothetical protein VE173_15805, partial [Longimicrobiales bacterium]|nr:hypothetical protein [Longimicrobiales bacterium]